MKSVWIQNHAEKDQFPAIVQIEAVYRRRNPHKLKNIQALVNITCRSSQQMLCGNWSNHTAECKALLEKHVGREAVLYAKVCKVCNGPGCFDETSSVDTLFQAYSCHVDLRSRPWKVLHKSSGMGTEQPTCLLADCPEFIEPAICFRNFTHLGRYETDVKPEEPGHEAPAETGSGVSVPSLFGIPSFDKKQDTNGKGQDESDEEEQRPEPEPPQKAEGECKTQ
ncbi:unnamed protein product [Durusdinium trenchii]|uniref:Uncharacterized protein n=1 Tax=Durusdinium trenchii TaxID=1381693 RepID=A0ABP0SMD5_9DINO